MTRFSACSDALIIPKFGGWCKNLEFCCGFVGLESSLDDSSSAIGDAGACDEETSAGVCWFGASGTN